MRYLSLLEFTLTHPVYTICFLHLIKIYSARIVAKNVLSTSELQQYSKQQDEQFELMKQKVFGNREKILLDELDTFRRNREKIGYRPNEEERLFQRLLAEHVYHKENQIRAAKEIGEIEYRLNKLQNILLNAKDIDRKYEFMHVLEERKCLVKIEEDLYRDILLLKEMIDRIEAYKLTGKKSLVDDVEQKEKQIRIREIKSNKEQVDIERKRLQDNIMHIKLGTFEKINHQQTSLLAERFNKKDEFEHYAPMDVFTIDKMQVQIRQEIERIRDLRVIILKHQN